MFPGISPNLPSFILHRVSTGLLVFNGQWEDSDWQPSVDFRLKAENTVLVEGTMYVDDDLPNIS